jgi:hypothetical protein
LEDGRYIALNRYYKPLGEPRKDWVVYEDHPSAQNLKGLTAAKAEAMSYKGSPSLDRIYFYNAGCAPTDSAENWAAYSKRLQVFAKLQINDE